MLIREAKQSDLKYIIELSKALLHLDIPGFKWDKKEYISKSISEHQYFVEEDSNQLGGFIQLINKQKHVQLETLAVSNQGKGIGRELVNFAIEYAKKLKIHQIKVSSYQAYLAVPFYQKMGFKRTRPGKAYGMRYFNLILRF